jgi:hypothetical protein
MKAKWLDYLIETDKLSKRVEKRMEKIANELEKRFQELFPNIEVNINYLPISGSELYSALKGFMFSNDDWNIEKQEDPNYVSLGGILNFYFSKVKGLKFKDLYFNDDGVYVKKDQIEKVINIMEKWLCDKVEERRKEKNEKDNI